MTRDEIIRMALEAGLAFPADEFPEIWQLYMDAGKDEIIRFANLVAEAAAAAEREACAKIVDVYDYARFSEECAKAIRARGEKGQP